MAHKLINYQKELVKLVRGAKGGKPYRGYITRYGRAGRLIYYLLLTMVRLCSPQVYYLGIESTRGG
jgi:hypothetical protein